jgi:Ca2+-dependent lipid-binding protein
MSGKLVIMPLGAKLSRDTELVGKMDPYCVLKIEDRMYRSQVDFKGGKTPMWKDEFRLKILENESQEKIMKIEVWDKEKIMQDDFVGDGVFDLSIVTKASGRTTHKVPIYYKTKQAGEVMFKFDFFKDELNFEETKPYEDIQNNPDVSNQEEVEIVSNKEPKREEVDKSSHIPENLIEPSKPNSGAYILF